MNLSLPSDLAAKTPLLQTAAKDAIRQLRPLTPDERSRVLSELGALETGERTRLFDFASRAITLGKAAGFFDGELKKQVRVASAIFEDIKEAV